MRALPSLGVRGRLVVALALTAPVALGSVTGGAGRMAQAQQVSPSPNDALKMPPERDFDRAEVERLFHEYQRLTGGLEPKRVPTGRFWPRAGKPTDRPRGDFWTPGELRQLFGR